MKWWPFQRKADDGSLRLFREIYGSRVSKSGQEVTLKDALRCATVLACARVIANGVAQVPLKLFQEDELGKKKAAVSHPLYQVLHSKPNPWQTSFELRETIALHLVLTGRAYCFKTIVGGKVRELIPFEPHKVTTSLADDGIRVIYKVQGNDGLTREFDESLIWHLKGPSWSGWEGLDPLELAREAVGLSISTEAQHARLHKNGVRASGVYSVEGPLSDKQYEDLRSFLSKNYAGDDNGGLPMIVDRGAKWLPTALSGMDAQHLETRKHQVEEVCRAMGVMPIMVFQSDKATTYASAEAMFLAHVVHTLAPWWTRIEQRIDGFLLTKNDVDSGIYARFVGAGLLRGSTKDRGEYYSKALGAGGSPAWMTQDEIRSLEELNPMGGDAARLPIASNVPRNAPEPAPAGA